MADLEHLQREAAIERLKLAQSLGALSGTASPQNLKAHGSALWGQYGSRIGTSLMAKARQNPAGFLLAGAGLAMLATGMGARKSQAATPSPATPLQEADLPPSPEATDPKPLVASALAVGVGTLVGALIRGAGQDEAATTNGPHTTAGPMEPSPTLDPTLQAGPTAPHWHP